MIVGNWGIHMSWRGIAGAVLIAMIPGTAIAAPGYYYYSPWSATLFAGPVTYSHFSRTFEGHFQVNGGMAGLMGDVRLFSLGRGFSIAAEGGFTDYGGKFDYTTAAAEIGFRYDNYPWSFAFYTGPSYATNPPTDRSEDFVGRHLLNAVSSELSYALPHSDGWGVALRLYHRSGAWGLYSLDNDEGTMFGIGVRKQF